MSEAPEESAVSVELSRDIDLEQTNNGSETAESGQIEESRAKRKNSDAEEPRKRARTSTHDEEKLRGRRLFGSLLGTLGGIKKEATSLKAQERATKQAELDERLKDRSQKAADEIAAREAQKEAEKVRKEAERCAELEKQREKAQQAHKVMLAGFLQTKNRPVLYYLPWRLNLDQEARIKAQKKLLSDEQVAHEPSNGVVSLQESPLEEVAAEYSQATPIDKSVP